MDAGFLFIELLLAPVGAASADDANGFFIPVRKNYGEQPIALRNTDNDKAIFRYRMENIAKRRWRFVKNGHDLEKRHPMLAQVRVCLGVVPFEAELFHIRCS